jgi:acyl-coenzyme A synthetase/AMP-(fatty) acid ligase
VTESRLTELLAQPGDWTVSFGTDGSQQRWRELLAQAAGVRARLLTLDGERWAVNLSDTYCFTAALLGCLAAGRTPVLAPAPMLGTAADRLSLDGVIEPQSATTQAPQRLVWQEVEPIPAPLKAIDPFASLVLFTSGSTGVPKEVGRRVRNLEAELTALETLWGEGLRGCRVFSTVSHRHVYGLLFRALWPLLERRPFATFDFDYPEQLLGAVGAGNALISSPALLKRVGHLPPASGQWRAIFSSGGMLAGEAVTDAIRVLGVCPTQILGSTETSGVAWRAQAPGFRALPGVESRITTDELLEVRSEFSGQEGWVPMGDRVRFNDDCSFELLGRADHVAKIEDKRVSLTEVERCLLEHAWVKEAAAVALEDRARQYVGAVVELSDAGRAALTERGRAAVTAALKVAVRGRIDPVAVPRVFRFPDVLPVDAQGKRQLARLKELFARTR